MLIPQSLAWLASEPSGREWLETLPRLVSDAAERWGLDVGEAFTGSHVSYVAPAARGDEAVVLKVQWPHLEAVYEAEALRLWGGDGAVRLLEHDAASSSLLLERAVPGTYLSTVDSGTALDVLAELLPRLWKPAGVPFDALADEALRWADDLGAKRHHGRVVDAAVALLRDLAGTQREPVLLHQDLHGDNVVRAQRLPWLAIDPKPLAGEREFGVAPIVRSAELGHSAREVWYRLDRLTADLGLDRDRAHGWTVGQTVAWAFDGDWVGQRHLEIAGWLLDGRPATRL